MSSSFPAISHESYPLFSNSAYCLLTQLYAHLVFRQVKRKLDLIVPSVVFNHSGQSCLPLSQIDYDLISLRFQLIIKRLSFIDCCVLLKLYVSFFNIRYNTNTHSLRDSIFFSKYLLRKKFMTPLLKNNESVKSQNRPRMVIFREA